MEEFIFDDDVDEVGAEVEAHCPKCKADTQHVVVSKYEDEIRRVQCNPCGDVHPYRKPRGESDEEEAAPAAKKKAVKAKPTWEQVMAKHAKKQPKTYQLGEYFKTLIDERRGGDGKDLISVLACVEDDGQHLTDDEIFAFLRLMLPAGAETTYRSSSNLMFGLLGLKPRVAFKDESTIGKEFAALQ